MKTGLILGASALAVAAVVVAAVPLQDAKAKSRDDHAAHGAMDPAMQAKQKELSTPGPEHAEMKKLVGTWDVQMKCWMDPSQPPEESNGTAMFEMTNGRHLVQNYSGSMMGQPYTGVGLMAFNNATKQYEHVWRDDMNTGMMWSTGTKGADGSITMKGTSHCVMGEMSCRTVQSMKGDNAMHFEMYCTMAGQPETKVMEIDYTRGASR
jgi:hypothetical protein